MKQYETLADAVVDCANCGILVVDNGYNIVEINQWLLNTANMVSNKVIGQQIFSVFPGSKSPSFTRALEQAINYGFSSVLSNALHPHLLPLYSQRSGEYKIIEQQCYLLPLKLEGQYYAMLQIQDVTGVVSRQQKLQVIVDSLKKFSLAVEHSPSSVIITNIEGFIEYVNQKFTEITGYQPSEAVGKSYFSLFSNDTTAELDIEIQKSLKAGSSWLGEKLNRKKNGDLYWSKEHISPILNGFGKATHFVAMQEDVTEVHDITEKISYQASHDMLTGLLNRHKFEQIITELVETAKEHDEEHVLCILDLDQFKIVNDTCGHVVGDELLRQISSTILVHLSRNDNFARIGGDEFAIVLRHYNLEAAKRIAQDLIILVEGFRFRWEKHIFTVGISIGITVINSKTVSSIDTIKQADSACYAAKDAGRNRIHVYHDEDDRRVQRKGDTYWVTQINEAWEHDRFVLYAQPIVSILTDDKLSYEVLVRMKRANGELVAPGLFLPPAERFNLSHRIDQWVIGSTFKWLNAHRDEVDHIDHISINLSGQTLCNEVMLKYIQNSLDRCAVESSKISFEITETAAIANLRHAQHFINTLRKYGCKFALDDFGSGLSSFAYLKNLQVDILKIDGMFVKDIIDDPIDEAMVRSINDVGHVIGMKTIAEFVENDEIKQRLIKIGVDYGQGYGLGKPTPIDEILLKKEVTA